MATLGWIDQSRAANETEPPGQYNWHPLNAPPQKRMVVFYEIRVVAFLPQALSKLLPEIISFDAVAEFFAVDYAAQPQLEFLYLP